MRTIQYIRIIVLFTLLALIGSRQAIIRQPLIQTLSEDLDEVAVIKDKRFNPITLPNDISPALITQAEIKKLIIKSNESFRALAPKSDFSNHGILIFVSREEHEGFMLEIDDTAINTVGHCSGYIYDPTNFMVITRDKDYRETLGTLNHERVHCMFGSHNEILTRFAELLMSLDQAMVHNDHDWVRSLMHDWEKRYDLANYPLIELADYLDSINLNDRKRMSLESLVINGSSTFVFYNLTPNKDYLKTSFDGFIKSFLKNHRRRYLTPCYRDINCTYFMLVKSEQKQFVKHNFPVFSSLASPYLESQIQ